MTDSRITGNAYGLNEVQEAERNRHMWKLRLDGKTQAEIAAEVGLSQSQVSRIFSEMVKDYVLEELDTYLSIQLNRLEMVAETSWELAQAEYYAHGNGRLIRDENGNVISDIGPKLAAVAKYMDAIKEINKLRGLYAPEKKEVSTKVEVNPTILSLIQQTQESDDASQD